MSSTQFYFWIFGICLTLQTPNLDSVFLHAVVIVGDYPIDTFVLQARVPLDEKPVGRWQTTSTEQTTFSCQDGGADTVTNAGDKEVQRVEAMWIAPESETWREIEFMYVTNNILL